MTAATFLHRTLGTWIYYPLSKQSDYAESGSEQLRDVCLDAGMKGGPGVNRLLLVLGLSVSSLFAQTAAIWGVISDPSGLSVANATVSIQSQDTGVTPADFIEPA